MSARDANHETPVLAARPADAGVGRRYTLLLLTALSAMNQLDRQLLNILIEPIRRTFALSDVQIGLLAGVSFVVIYTVMSVPAAIWAVRYNRRNLLAVSALAWGAITSLCGFTQSYWQLFIARFGVGIGEAGGMPPSHAIISDLYGPGERATAMSTWAAGINAGIFFAFLFGGIIGQFYGWRIAFILAGGVTVVLAAGLWLTVGEPKRAPASPQAAASASLLMTTLRVMAADRVIRQVFWGATLAGVVGSASITWLPPLLMRVHHITIAGTGIYLALVVGAGGALGTWLGGLAVDRLRLHDIRWSLWFVAVVLLVTKPFFFGFLLADDRLIALALFVVPGIAGAIFVGPSLAVLHNRVPAALRPIASAVFLLVVNFVGLGIGPLLAGALSQYVFAGHGTDALRYSLFVTQFVAIWAAVHYYFAGAALAPKLAVPTQEQR